MLNFWKFTSSTTQAARIFGVLVLSLTLVWFIHSFLNWSYLSISVCSISNKIYKTSDGWCKRLLLLQVCYLSGISPSQKYFKLWERLINRKDFRITANTMVCSNHFAHVNQWESTHIHINFWINPELWLRGYGPDKKTHNHNVLRIIESWNDVDEQSDVFITTRTGAIKRKATYSHTSSTNLKRLKFYLKTLTVEMNQPSLWLCLKCRKEIMNILEENERLKNENEQLQKSLTYIVSKPSNYWKHQERQLFCRQIKHSDSLMKLYTGIDNYDSFEWIK